MNVTPLDLAQKFLGIKEVAGGDSNPHVLAMLRLDQAWPANDDVPWCSAFVNYLAWLLGLPRSRSLSARSWLKVGLPVPLRGALLGDVVVLSRGSGPQPGPDVLAAPGHVGIFAGYEDESREELSIVGGNQSNAVTLQTFPMSRVLGIRRLE